MKILKQEMKFRGNGKKILKIESIIKYYVRYVHVQVFFSLESLSKRLFTIQLKLHKNISILWSPAAIVFYLFYFFFQVTKQLQTTLYVYTGE